MNFIRTGIIIIVLMITGLLAGDFMNMPLWPIDWLKTSMPVEIQFVLDNINEEISENVFRNSRFYDIYLRKPNGKQIRKLSMDKRGFSRFVIQKGRYNINALVTSIDQGKWYLFVSADDSDTEKEVIQIDQSGQEIQIHLRRKNEISNTSKQKILTVYLQEGDYPSALILAQKISINVKNDIDDLIRHSEQLQELTLDSYCSIIENLQEISGILQRYQVEPDDQIVYINKDIVYVDSRCKAVRQARNDIVKSYIEIMDEFHGSGRLMAVLQEWNQLKSNPELFRKTTSLPDELTSELARFEIIVAEVNYLLPAEIRTNYDQGVELYEAGNLIKARKKLTRLFTYMRNLNLAGEYEEIETNVVEYLEDIEIIAAANQAIRTDKLEKALLLFDLIARPNDLVMERMEETRGFLKMRNRKVAPG
ncbi:hypothetical protein K8T06_15865 [bacterium]|nr:hypothetical protein [bacterium]